VKRQIAIALLAVVACNKPSTNADPSRAAKIEATIPAEISEETAARFYDAWARQFEADAQIGSTRVFSSEVEADGFVESLTPANFKPRSEFFASFVDGGSDFISLMSGMNAFVRMHPEATNKDLDALMPRIEAATNLIIANVTKQFPHAAEDPNGESPP
jgi:hypothetical protein